MVCDGLWFADWPLRRAFAAERGEAVVAEINQL